MAYWAACYHEYVHQQETYQKCQLYALTSNIVHLPIDIPMIYLILLAWPTWLDRVSCLMRTSKVHLVMETRPNYSYLNHRHLCMNLKPLWISDKWLLVQTASIEQARTSVHIPYKRPLTIKRFLPSTTHSRLDFSFVPTYMQMKIAAWLYHT